MASFAIDTYSSSVDCVRDVTLSPRRSAAVVELDHSTRLEHLLYSREEALLQARLGDVARLDDERCAAMPCVVCTAGGCPSRRPIIGRFSPSASARDPLLALTGCRRNEILTLRWEDVRLDAGELRLRDSKTGPRIVPISPAAAKILGELPRIPGNPWVVPGREAGAPLSGIFLQWRRARGLAGPDDVRLHDLRHTCASSSCRLDAYNSITVCNIVFFNLLFQQPDFADFSSVYKRSADWTQWRG